MAELTLKSPGVSTREIDLSGPSKAGPVGTPAGVIGTATKGRAFVPLIFANLSEFVAEFGAVGSDHFGPMALREWFSNARAGLYLRVLGAGDGKARIDSSKTNAKGESQQAGSVLNAGFVVGERQVDPSTGRLAHNAYAGSNVAPVKATGKFTTVQTPTTGHMITIVSTTGLAKTYKFVNAGNNADVDGDGTIKILNTGGSVAAAQTLIKDAINHANGHGSEAAATRLVAGDVDGEAGAVLLTQSAGQGGNIQILTHQALDNVAAATGITVNSNLSGGVDGQGLRGQTHILGCLMRETAHAKASATIKVAAHGSALAPGGDFPKIVGKGITLTSTDGTTKQYVVVDGNTDNPGKTTGDLIEAGDVLGTVGGAITVSATDSRIGAVAVVVGNAVTDTQQTFLTALESAIDHSNGHGAADTKIKITKTNGQLALEQVKFGRLGNTDISSDITLSAVTVADAFSGGLGELIFHEAGVGLDSATPATGVKFAPVVRGVLMFASGVVPAMSSSRTEVTNNTAIGQQVSVAAKKATATLSVDGVITANGKFTLVSGATRLTYEARGAKSLADGYFDQNDGANTAATTIAECINHTADGRAIGITAVAVANVVHLTQDTAGIAGNTIILNDCDQLTVSNSTAKAKLGFFSGGTAAVVQASANSSGGFGNLAGLDNGGSSLGAVDIKDGKQEFVMLLNGHKSTTTYPNAITASFDPQSTNYFANLFNTDPNALEKAGHVLYTHYDVFNTYATPAGADNPYLTATGRAGYVSTPAQELEEVGFLMKSAQGRNSSHETAYPNLEDFSDRFRTAVSPWIRSQKFGGEAQDLFKVHSLDDGEGGNTVYKISIENLRRSQSDKDRYGSFDLVVRDFNDSDREPVVLERFSALSLNPKSDRYISRIIGDYRLFYDFDKRQGSQKLALTGKFANVSKNIRIEVAADVASGVMDPTALPFGFRGIPSLQINGASSTLFSDPDTSSDTSIIDSSALAHRNFRLPPVPLRRNIGLGVVPKKRSNSSFYWGIQFEADDQYFGPNKNSKHASMMPSLTKYLPDFATAKLPLLLRDHATSDSNNNNEFSLENIQVATNSSDQPDSKEWAVAEYRRDGILTKAMVDTNGTPVSTTRFLNSQADLDLGSVRRFLKFTTYVQGGFDGVNIFDKEKSSLSDTAVKREIDWPEDQGGKNGSTAATYLKAIDVLAEKSDVDIQLLAIPGIRQTLVTDKAVEAVEDRFDAMYLMDTIVYDADNLPVTGSSQKVSVTNTVNNFSNRVLDSSFAAAYFPDVILQDPATGINVQAPPSVSVLGAFALNDQLAHPWFAPAGFTRGAMSNVLESQVKLNRENLDSLYEADINPITSFPHSEGVVVFGQKTLLRTQSSLDRVNVRRLLIEIRRRVKSVANNFIFEPNREETLARFSSQVNPILRQIQQQQGVDRFLVKIDTSTTTQNDVENNTLRGKIFLQPTRSVEFISLDFVVTNAGAEI